MKRPRDHGKDNQRDERQDLEQKCIFFCYQHLTSFFSNYSYEQYNQRGILSRYQISMSLKDIASYRIRLVYINTLCQIEIPFVSSGCFWNIQAFMHAAGKPESTE